MTQKQQRIIYILLIWFLGHCGIAQQQIVLDVRLDTRTHTLEIEQDIVYTNTSNETLSEIYLLDWANAFSSKTSALAKRFAENFDNRFHFETQDSRGYTAIDAIWVGNQQLDWKREATDIIRIALPKKLQNNNTVRIKAKYTIALPSTKFTRFGYEKDGSYNLRYWHLTPAVYQNGWQAYSHKNIDDYFQEPTKYKVTLTLTNTSHKYHLYSILNNVSNNYTDSEQQFVLEGHNKVRPLIFIRSQDTFQQVNASGIQVFTSLDSKKINHIEKALALDRIINYLKTTLGPYPFDKMVVSDAEYRNQPVYGFNLLPSFLNPYPKGFEFEIEHLKIITRQYLTQTLHINPRKHHGLYGALQIYLMQDYVNTYYPDMKMAGKLSNIGVLKWTQLSKLKFNDQYPLLYLNMARNNLQQAITTPKDSLVKFNKNIASDYYAGSGLRYLEAYLGGNIFKQALKDFYSTYNGKLLSANALQHTLESHTKKPINWFFEGFLKSREAIDFKIQKAVTKQDSTVITLTQKSNSALPVVVTQYVKNEAVNTQWSTPFIGKDTIKFPFHPKARFAINADGVIPEINRRNNYHKPFNLLNKPLQFRPFQDAENPEYNQLFFMPIFEYNLYDGVTVGTRVYNKTILPRPIQYDIEPQYGLTSKSLVGRVKLRYTKLYPKGSLYALRLGVNASNFSYNTNLFYKRLSAYLTLAYRPKDLRSNQRQFLQLKTINVLRDQAVGQPLETPNYSIFNLRYNYSNRNLINFFTGNLDYQLAKNFSKLALEVEYRKLYLNNRQLNLRFFAGTFLFNDTPNNNFFNFALDRPTDYLFNYNYYGRSEAAGLFSQQIVVAEGGFKSKLQPAFSNQWLTTVNASTNLWKWIYAYGDFGLVKNRHQAAQWVYDSGIRLSLIPDFFEVFFPLYSNLGWEPTLGNYSQRIRFIITLEPKTLFGLFTREWY